MNMRLTKVIVVALASAWGGVANATDPPPQIQYLKGIVAGAEQALDATYKRSNGTSTSSADLMLRILFGEHPNEVPTACYLQGLGQEVSTMTQLSDQAYSSAIAANYGGVIVGESDATDFAIFPCYWSNASSPNPVRGTNNVGGRFWDVNAAGVAVGVWFTNQGKQQAFAFDGSDTSEIDAGSYDGAAARAINNDTHPVIGGQLFDGTNNSPPAVWLYDTQHSVYGIVDIGANPDYQAEADGRDGYIVGITDSVEGDDSGPYAVGYVLPGANPETTPGRPFIYSIGSRKVKWVSTQYGEPQQVGNTPYTSGVPVVTFVGNTPLPYLWIGSPDKNVANDGVADDVWALFDPDAGVRDEGVPQTVTGLNREGFMGGAKIDNTHIVWMSHPESDAPNPWQFVSTSPTLSIVTGTGVGGSVSDLATVEGKYLTLDMGSPSPSTDPEWVVQVEETLASGQPSNLAVRTTVRSEHTGTYTQKFWLYNWDTTNWDQIGSSLTLRQYMQSPRAVVSGSSTIDHYVDGSGHIAARVSVKKGLTGVVSPDMSFEQLRIMVK